MNVNHGFFLLLSKLFNPDLPNPTQANFELAGISSQISGFDNCQLEEKRFGLKEKQAELEDKCKTGLEHRMKALSEKF